MSKSFKEGGVSARCVQIVHTVAAADIVTLLARRVGRVDTCTDLVLPHVGAAALGRSTSLVGRVLSALLASPLAVALLSIATALCHAAAATTSHRTATVAAFVCHALLYIWSQANNYQHEYLLIVLCALDAVIAVGTSSAAEWARLRARAWAAQMAIVYWWTAIAKVDRRWWNGETLAAVLRGPDHFGLSRPVTTALARLTLLGELVACLAMASLALRPHTAAPVRAAIALSLAIAHLGLKFFNFAIGSFVEIVLLVVVVVTVDEAQPLPRLVDRVANGAARLLDQLPRVVSALVAAASVGLTLHETPAVPTSAAVAIALAVGLALATRGTRALAGRLALACLLVVTLAVGTASPSMKAAHAVAVGDDAATRGLHADAAAAYDRAVTADPTRAQSWVALAVTTKRATGKPLPLDRLTGALSTVQVHDHWQLHFARVSVAVDSSMSAATICAAVADFLSVPKTTLSCADGEECARLRNFRASAIQGVTRVRDSHKC